ncbi:DUF2537 domain-containing protein [Nocardia asteroides]|uniref:DUF2537 domain-containing protein n=1 Tax=Nocardia asteroides TaxID=1824 RepID=UPI00031A11E6|nr:DUF2537 domain-containing protein [Nocardia asteroides]UGT47911.1 DUF2537 domain-containing protein [Nocardia asteroides]SFM59160.1 Protein of unknown function [Nocardia asteroides]VEG33156.1 Protein of uncharacterised function (DUF2537) [Nocardia asteroides]
MKQEPDGPYRAQPDSVPWAAGCTVIVLVAALGAVGVYAFGAALATVHPLLALVVNVVAAGGVAPTAWRWRFTPVVRWVLAGAALGVVAGWLAVLVEVLTG